jgi:amino acid permease
MPYINNTHIQLLYTINRMKKTNWFYVSLTVSIIGFIVTWLQFQNWKISLTLSVLSGLFTLSFNPVRRYMKAFWSVLSLLITMNTFSLKFALNFFNENSIGELETQLGTSSIILSISLVLLCSLLLVLDFFERNGISNSKKVKMTQKGGKNSKNYQSKGDINITNND